jgi:hypothetical protein
MLVAAFQMQRPHSHESIARTVCDNGMNFLGVRFTILNKDSLATESWRFITTETVVKKQNI